MTNREMLIASDASKMLSNLGVSVRNIALEQAAKHANEQGRTLVTTQDVATVMNEAIAEAGIKVREDYERSQPREVSISGRFVQGDI